MLPGDCIPSLPRDCIAWEVIIANKYATRCNRVAAMGTTTVQPDMFVKRVKGSTNCWDMSLGLPLGLPRIPTVYTIRIYNPK